MGVAELAEQDSPLSDQDAASIADIDRLMVELQTARDFLQSEAERVRRINARYAHLAQTASASVKVIADSLGRWRDTDASQQPHAAMPRPEAPSLSPPQEAEAETAESDQ